MALSGSSGFVGTRSARRSTSRRGTGFLVEALFVLALLMACMAVVVRLFLLAQTEGARANRVSEAVIVATSCAEEFCAHPTHVEGSSSRDGYDVACQVTPERRENGVLYEAHIVVSAQGETLYELDTARYVSGGESS